MAAGVPECREDGGAAPAEQGRERVAVAVAVGGRSPQRSQPARRVDERRLPRLVEHREDPRPSEGGRDEQQPAAAQLDLLLVGAIDLEHPVSPVDLGMEVLEDLDGAARGQAPRAVQDVVLERGPDLRPPRRDRAVEVAGHHRRQLREAALRIVEQRPGRVGHGRALEAPADLARDALVRRAPHAGQLVVELGQRRRRGRRHEVGRVAVRRGDGEQVEQLEVEALQAPARRARPWQVQRVRGRVAQDVGAPRQVEERRDREAGANQVLVAEAEADHGPILPQPSAESESSRARRGRRLRR